MRRICLVGLLAATCGMPWFAAAQTIGPCDGHAVHASNVMMPPEVAIRSFANGAIRVIGLDTVEPVCCWAHLMVEYPQVYEGYPGCVLISGAGGLGFAGLDMAALTASYDPGSGLMLSVPAGFYEPETGRSRMSPLRVTINQAAETVTAEWQGAK